MRDLFGFLERCAARATVLIRLDVLVTVPVEVDGRFSGAHDASSRSSGSGFSGKRGGEYRSEETKPKVGLPEKLRSSRWLVIGS
jgi:hypothetical protein